MCRSILKPGLKLPSIIIGAFAFITVLPASPPLIASNTRCGSTPALRTSVNASATAAMFSATMTWLASLVVLPAPIGPQCTALQPITSRMSLTSSNSSSWPPTMIASVPSTAFGSPPETGASSIRTFLLAQAFSTSWLASGAIEDMSIRIRPSFAPSSTPPSPITTLLTCGLLGSIVITKGTWPATSAALLPAFAPAATTFSTFSFTTS